MSKIVRYLDNSYGCWSRVDLSDGTPLFISLAQTGILIKKSRLGILGPKLFKEEIVERLARMCQTIDSNITNYSTPEGIKNPVLKVFTQVALDSSSPAEFINRLNLLSNKIQKQNSNSASNVSNENKLTNFYKIVEEYGKVIEETSQMVGGVPISKLPYGILDIQEALLEVAYANREKNDIVDRCRTGFMMLADFIEDSIAIKNDKIREIWQNAQGLSEADIRHVFTEMDMDLQMQEEIKQNKEKFLYVFDEALKKIIKHHDINSKKEE